MNNLSTGTSVFMYYFPAMEPSSDHYDDFTTVLPDPDADTDDIEDYPYYVPVDADVGTKVQWMEYECPPSGFTHFGPEWDWLDFYWNLWTDGYPNRYTIDEINEIWNNMPESRMRVRCCTNNIPFPANCPTETDLGTGTPCTSPTPNALLLGKTWTGHTSNYPDSLSESVEDIWWSVNQTKFNNFVAYGVEAGVDY